MSVPCALLGALYGAFSNATIALPQLFPVTTNTLNFAPVGLAAAIILALCLFGICKALPDAAWHFVGPLQPAVQIDISYRAYDVTLGRTVHTHVKPPSDAVRLVSAYLNLDVSAMRRLTSEEKAASRRGDAHDADGSVAAGGSSSRRGGAHGSRHRSAAWHAAKAADDAEVAAWFARSPGAQLVAAAAAAPHLAVGGATPTVSGGGGGGAGEAGAKEA